MSPSDAVAIRPATRDDVPLILAFIHKKAAFDRSTGAFHGELHTTPARIEATLFGDPRFAHALIADHRGAPRGFALFYYRYSSFQGRPSLWLDDLYIDEDARSLGIGAAVLARLRELAAGHHCTHLAWTASVNNPRGLAFYARAGATITARDDVQVTLRLAI